MIFVDILQIMSTASPIIMILDFLSHIYTANFVIEDTQIELSSEVDDLVNACRLTIYKKLIYVC